MVTATNLDQRTLSVAASIRRQCLDHVIVVNDPSEGSDFVPGLATAASYRRRHADGARESRRARGSANHIHSTAAMSRLKAIGPCGIV
jgi:hypothetical protein